MDAGDRSSEAGGTARAVAAIASFAAGTIHLAAAIARRDDPSALRLLLLVGVAQMGWAVLAGWRGTSRWVAALGAVLSAGALIGWVVAKTVGLDLVTGGVGAEPVGLPDAVAASMALVTLVVTLRAVLVAPGSSSRAPQPAWTATVGLVSVVAVAASVVALPGFDERAGLATEPIPDTSESGLAKPYNPAQPIDLSGVAGVSATDERAAEDLVRSVLVALPAYADTEAAVAAGYRSIGDSFTGSEHFVNWSYVLDDDVLDVDRPEALVYRVEDDGGRTLEAAMFMAAPGTTTQDQPDVGGPLTAWHLHGELCLTGEGSGSDAEGDASASIGGITDVSGGCPEGMSEVRPMPTLHVWVVSHPCGPFAELEGVGTEGAAATAELCASGHGH